MKARAKLNADLTASRVIVTPIGRLTLVASPKGLQQVIFGAKKLSTAKSVSSKANDHLTQTERQLRNISPANERSSRSSSISRALNFKNQFGMRSTKLVMARQFHMHNKRNLCANRKRFVQLVRQMARILSRSFFRAIV